MHISSNANSSASPAPMATGAGQRLLTKAELIEYLHISRSHVNRLVFERGLPHIKIGKSIRFRIDEVLAWLSRHGGY